LNQTFKVTDPSSLLAFLFEKITESNKTRIRQILKRGYVSIGGRVTTQFDFALQIGDEVQIATSKPRPAKSGLQIIYEDADLIAISKPVGLLSIASDNNQGNTAISAVNDHVCKETGKNTDLKENQKSVYIVHSLDRDVSGVMLFSKSESVKSYLQKNWIEFTKEYSAVVEGRPAKSSGTRMSYLGENKMLQITSGPKRPGARKSITHYEIIRSGKKYSLLSVKLGSGRRHQIRVHLADLGCPITGDKNYGAKTNPLKRIALHACSLKLIHPKTRIPLEITSPPPASFENLVA